MPHNRTPPCPQCQTLSSWIRSAPAKPDFVAHAYECPKCAFIRVEVERDPLIECDVWLISEMSEPK
jgi:hypothetical protein